MPAAGVIKYAYLAYFAKPTADRSLYRLVQRERACRIVELGIGSLTRTANLIAVAQRYSPQADIHYAAIDWFDTRPRELAALKLIDAHRQLKSTGAKVRLLPGNPGYALRDVANTLQKTDLLLIDLSVADADLAPAWFYLPRMCHPRTTVWRCCEQAGGVAYCPLSFAEIAERASTVKPARAA